MFKPTFTTVKTLRKAADIINQPHEDYPSRVSNTLTAMEKLCAAFRNNSLLDSLTPATIRAVHRMIMHDLPDKGEYRTCPVKINGCDVGAPIYDIVPRIQQLCDSFKEQNHQGYMLIHNIKEWYKIFEEIHPFSDGNGRVGGIFVVALSSRREGKSLLVPRV